jgi:16S rRNA (guanine527-N7)-methyltransferase
VKSAEFRERLLSRAGVAGRNLSTKEIFRLEAYFRLLSHWNRRINLTALGLEPASDEAIDRLLVEPLAAAQYVQDSPLDWFDLGSGGGSPAFPLKIVRPGMKLKLVEARSRKAAFLREVARALEFPDVEVINERLEAVAARRESVSTADLITVRAVRTDAASAKAARLLLRDDGQLLLFSRSNLTSELQVPGFAKILTVELVPHRESQLVVFRKSVFHVEHC